MYIDTLFVCTATALMILCTGMYNVENPAGGFLVEGLVGVEAGPGYTQAAIEQVLPGFGASFVALALLFFCFTTIVAYYYIAETNIEFINRKVHRPWLSFILKIALLVSVTYGSVRSASAAWNLGDMGVGIMAWLNIIAILIVQKPALACLRDYEAQKKAGIDPLFNPDDLGIKNAELWHDIRKKQLAAREQS